MFAAIDIALLESEWAAVGEEQALCPCCDERKYEPHASGCAMDQALAERGFDTRESRDAARGRIRVGTAGTEPPPP